MSILILGHARHGKDTFAEMLVGASKGVLSFSSSSEFVAKHLMFPLMRDEMSYLCWEECHEDRIYHRSRWHDEIKKYNKPDPTRLTREILAEHDIYVGMRSSVEFDASVKAGLFDVIYWVDASDRKLPEPKSSMDIEFDADVMIRIDNNGREEELERQAQEIYQMMEGLSH